MKPITQEWVKKAEGDYHAGNDLWRAEEPVYDAICFHAQQCAEKYLKAWLVEHDMNVPKTHDLEALAQLCASSLPVVSSLTDDLSFLTSFAVEIRYPGASADRLEAQRCWQASLKVRDLIRGKLGA